MQEYFIHYKPEKKEYKLPDAIKIQLSENNIKITYQSKFSYIIMALIPDDKIESVQSIDSILRVSLNKSEYD